ncbi:hypothetical protein NVS55_08475 [Myxococcus stipitatus]|uniref:hypothetical protein n=1 Tax=Myxococcus stipitatus TaxID=83455 RepID=UPI0031454A25
MVRPERHVRVRAVEFSPERLDTGFYARAYFDTREAIRQSGLKTESLGSVCEPWQFGAYALCNHIEWSDAASGVPYVKAEALGSPLLNESGLAYVTPATHRLLEKSQLKPGDIVVSTSGTIGLCAVLPERLGDANSNQDTIKFNPSSAGYDCHFVAAWVASAPGQVFLNREAGGAVQQHVYLYNFKRLPLLKVAAEAQRYIGDKVRQAERLRERARRLEAEFRSAVTVAIPSSSLMAGKTSRVATGELGRNLNPGAYTPDRRAVRAAIRGAGGRSLDTLADVESPTTDSYPATAPYLGLDAIDSATCGLKPSTAGAEAVAGAARLLREGPALSRLRPYLNKVTYIPPTLAGGIGSTELLLVRPKAGVDGWFLYGVLKLESSVRQLNPVATGSTHPRVDREDVLDLLVPWRDEHEALGAKLRTAQACYRASAALTVTATTLVEHLIDGRMTEAELVAAQKALEAGDRSADREILKALVQGDAPDAKPVIADVDALYALLDGSEGPDA